MGDQHIKAVWHDGKEMLQFHMAMSTHCVAMPTRKRSCRLAEFGKYALLAKTPFPKLGRMSTHNRMSLTCCPKRGLRSVGSDLAGDAQGSGIMYWRAP